jgi:hypothetical protein
MPKRLVAREFNVSGPHTPCLNLNEEGRTLATPPLQGGRTALRVPSGSGVRMALYSSNRRSSNRSQLSGDVSTLEIGFDEVHVFWSR